MNEQTILGDLLYEIKLALASDLPKDQKLAAIRVYVDRASIRQRRAS